MRLVVAIFLLFFSTSCKEKYEYRYYDNGKIKSKLKTENGTYNGDFYSYYQTGQLWAKGQFKNGLCNGLLVKYFPNGVLKERSTWKDGLLNGTVEVFDSLGNILLHANYRDGFKIGYYRIFFKTGELSEVQLFDNNSNLFYFLKYSEPGIKSIELFYPICSLSKVDQLNHITFQVKLSFSGNAFLTIGLSEFEKFTPLNDPIEFSDTIPKVIHFPDSIDVRKLFYKFAYYPSESDTLSGFEIGKSILNTSKDELERLVSPDFI